MGNPQCPQTTQAQATEIQIVLPFDETDSSYVAHVTKSVAPWSIGVPYFLRGMGEKQSVDAIVNESLKKGVHAIR